MFPDVKEHDDSAVLMPMTEVQDEIQEVWQGSCGYSESVMSERGGS